MRYAIIEDGTVINIIEAMPGYSGDGNAVADKKGRAAIGGSYDGKKFTAPPEPVITKAEIDKQRLAAYAREADPLFFKWQAGESSEQEWLAKRADIKGRFAKTLDQK